MFAFFPMTDIVDVTQQGRKCSAIICCKKRLSNAHPFAHIKLVQQPTNLDEISCRLFSSRGPAERAHLARMFQVIDHPSIAKELQDEATVSISRNLESYLRHRNHHYYFLSSSIIISHSLLSPNLIVVLHLRCLLVLRLRLKLLVLWILGHSICCDQTLRSV